MKFRGPSLFVTNVAALATPAAFISRHAIMPMIGLCWLPSILWALPEQRVRD